MARTLLLCVFALLVGCGRESGNDVSDQSATKTPLTETAPSDGVARTSEAASKRFFIGRWASSEASCRDASWKITEGELQTPGEVACRFHRVTRTARGFDVNATCWAEGPPQEWTLQFAYAESARALLIENAPFADVGLIRCGDSAISNKGSSSVVNPKRDDDSSPMSARAAADVLLRYFELSRAGRLQEASELWTASERTRASKWLQENETAQIRREVRVGEPGRVEGAAGSLYVTIPIQLHTTGNDGADVRQSGEATLRRSNNIPGATPEQLAWRIVRIDLEATKDR